MRVPEEGMDLHHEVTVFDLDAPRDETSEADGNVCHLRKSDKANEFKSSALEPELNKISAVSALRPDSQSYPAAATRVAMSQQQVCSFEQNLEKGDECMRAQGGKPRPAKLDLSKPSRSGKRTPSQESQQKLPSLRSTLQAAKHLYKNAGARSKKDIHQPFPKSGKHKLSRLEKGAEHLQRVNKNTKWRRHRRQWSSAQEPNLSPIPQSVVKTKSATRRELKTRPSKPHECESETCLINLGELAPLPPCTSQPSDDQPSLYRSDSLSSVVRSPHWQSFVDQPSIGPSALELFENGIDFERPGTRSLSKQGRSNECTSKRPRKWLGKGPEMEIGSRGTSRELTSPIEHVTQTRADHSYLSQQTADASPQDIHSIHALTSRKVSQGLGHWMPKGGSSRISYRGHYEDPVATRVVPPPAIVIDAIPLMTDDWGKQLASELGEGFVASALETPMLSPSKQPDKHSKTMDALHHLKKPEGPASSAPRMPPGLADGACTRPMNAPTGCGKTTSRLSGTSVKSQGTSDERQTIASEDSTSVLKSGQNAMHSGRPSNTTSASEWPRDRAMLAHASRSKRPLRNIWVTEAQLGAANTEGARGADATFAKLSKGSEEVPPVLSAHPRAKETISEEFQIRAEMTPKVQAFAEWREGTRDMSCDLDTDNVEELSQAFPAPGSFPDQRNKGSTHTSHLDSLELECELDLKGERLAVLHGQRTASDTFRELFSMAWCYLLAFFLVYWDKVGIVFNPNSEYWARHGRNEATLEDCYVFALALPGIFVLVAAVIWVMRLLTICGEQMATLKELLTDVTWFLTGR
ncbi:hypothetical protein AAL_02719 [Moelleriella libera RCEF 2490]|uniref:Transmembrane protein n=1 Tax=Moelleriella libera RCEF 2490 TaxID=1081109 RepID=A0A168EUQ2_9HYPO|nr:hypothetical protein AAL_02719 [Moelleriella libera RCEF 2490]